MPLVLLASDDKITWVCMGREAIYCWLQASKSFKTFLSISKIAFLLQTKILPGITGIHKDKCKIKLGYYVNKNRAIFRSISSFLIVSDGMLAWKGAQNVIGLCIYVSVCMHAKEREREWDWRIRMNLHNQ